MRLFRKWKEASARYKTEQRQESIDRVEAKKKELEVAGKLDLELRLFDINCIEVQDGVSLTSGGWSGIDYWVSYSGMPSDDKFVLSRILWGGRSSIFEQDKPHKGIPYFMPKDIDIFNIGKHEFQVRDVNTDRLIIRYTGQGYAQLKE